jgi:hypothetical protein
VISQPIKARCSARHAFQSVVELWRTVWSSGLLVSWSDNRRDLGTGSKRSSYRLHAKITATDATPGEALGEGIDLIIMAPGKSQ